MRKVLLFLVLINSISACVQSQITVPKNYVLSEIPKAHSKEHSKLNYAEDISIKLNGNQIETFEKSKQKNSELKFMQGVLIGTDHGEWGGKLIFKTAKEEIEIKEGNIFSIFEINGKIYFLEGLAHGFSDYGEIYELKFSNNKFTYHKVLELPGEPETFTIINNKIYIATFEDFLIIKDWKVEYQIKGFWESLYPNSIIVENGNSIYLGIRGGIVQIIPADNKINLYTKK